MFLPFKILEFCELSDCQREEKFLISNSRAHSRNARRDTERERERERERETHTETGRIVSSVSLRERLYFSTQSREKRGRKREKPPLPGKDREPSRASSSNALI